MKDLTLHNTIVANSDDKASCFSRSTSMKKSEDANAAFKFAKSREVKIGVQEADYSILTSLPFRVSFLSSTTVRTPLL